MSKPGPPSTFTNYTDYCFQSQNGILLPSLRPALPFLDLHGMQRVEFHQSTMEQLRDRLLTRIVTLAASDDKNKLVLCIIIM